MDGQKGLPLVSEHASSHCAAWTSKGRLYSSLLWTASLMNYFAFMDYIAKEWLGVIQRDNMKSYAKNWFIKLTLSQCYQIRFGIPPFSVKFLQFLQHHI